MHAVVALCFLVLAHLPGGSGRIARHCYGLKSFHRRSDQPICCVRKQTVTHYVRQPLSEPPSTLGTKWDLLHDWKVGDERKVNLENPACGISLQRTAWATFVVHNAECCRTEGNRCCNLLPSDFFVEDTNGIPVCGRFIHSPSALISGMGHTIAEHNSNFILALMFGLHRIRDILRTPGHGMSRDALGEFIGDNATVPEARWHVGQVRRAVELGYLRQVNITAAAHILTPGPNTVDPNVVFWSTQQLNTGNGFDLTASWFLQHFRRLQLEGKMPTVSPFRAVDVNVVLHVRLGDTRTDGGRVLPIAYYVKVATQLLTVLNNSAVRFYLVSDGEPNDFTAFTEAVKPTRLVLGADGIVAFYTYLMNADILVTARSGYSHLAAELGFSVALAHPFWHKYSRSAPRLVPVEPSGLFNRTEFVVRFCAMRRCAVCSQMWWAAEFHW